VANTTRIWVGGSDVDNADDTTGWMLEPNGTSRTELIIAPGSGSNPLNLKNIYIDAGGDDEGVVVLYTPV